MELPSYILSREQIREGRWRIVEPFIIKNHDQLSDVSEEQAERFIETTRQRAQEAGVELPTELMVGQASMTHIRVANMADFALTAAVFGREAPVT